MNESTKHVLALIYVFSDGGPPEIKELLHDTREICETVAGSLPDPGYGGERPDGVARLVIMTEIDWAVELAKLNAHSRTN